jgi:Glutathione S-transferase, N-terminal domain
MAVKLLRCSGQWAKIKAHPCWKVEKALQDMGIDYERVNLPSGRGNRADIEAITGQKKYPAIQFEDGSVYREESKDMEATIRAGTLMDKARGAASVDGSG